MVRSIVQEDTERCFLCGMIGYVEPLDKHHIYGGALRNKSERYGLFVYLHHDRCHIFGEKSVHKNARINRKVQALAQKKAMEVYGWSEEDFIKEFSKNYLEE